MNVSFLKLGIWTGALLIGAGWFYRSHHRSRPRYIFVNETDDHTHDTALKMSLKLAEQRSGIENALVRLKRLPPDSTIEQTAEALFKRWAIGSDRGGKGILYLYSEAENLFKIEVSYGLEGIFPDVVCHRLEEGAKSFMLSEIPQDFLTELLLTMNIRGQENREELRAARSWAPAKFHSGGAGVSAKGYRRTLADYLSAVRELSAEEVKTFQPSTDPQETLRLYLKSLEMGLGEPQLPLLTEGSRVFRLVVPRSPAQQYRVLEYYQKASPPRLHVKDDLGVAVFRPGVANLPIVLRRARDSRWFVDEPKAWTYFHRFETENDYFLKYDDLPLASALGKKAVYGGRLPTPRPPSYPYSLSEAVAALERQTVARPTDPTPFAQLGELYLFEMNWESKAIEAFERAAALAPSNLTYRWRLYDLYLNHSEVEKMLGQLAFLTQALPKDQQVRQWHTFYTKQYAFPPGEF